MVDRRSVYLRSRRNNLLDINLTITLDLVGESINLQYVYLGSTCAKSSHHSLSRYLGPYLMLELPRPRQGS